MDDDANYLGFPVWKTCIFLNVASCVLYMFVLFFLPVSLAMPMMAVELAVGIVGLLASMSSYRFLTRIYLFVQSVMIVPVLCSCWNLIAIYNNFDYLYNVCWHNCDKYATHNEIRIMRIPWRILIAAMAFAGIGTALVVISLIGFRKLIRFQGKYVADIHTTQIFHSPPSKPMVVNHSMIPNSMGSNQMMQCSMTQTQMIPQPVYIVDPNKYNVVYQPYGIQQQVQGLPAQAPPMENLQVPPAYPVKGGKPNEEFPPGYQA